MAGEERRDSRRVTFTKIPSLGELILARMPQWKVSLKTEAQGMAILADKLGEIWEKRDRLPFNKRYIVGDNNALNFMEKTFGIERGEGFCVSYKRKNLLIGFSEDGDWYNIFASEIFLTPKSILLLNKVRVSKISSKEGENYGLFSIKFKFRGATLEHGKVTSGLLILLKPNEIIDLRTLFAASQV
jgi:hypothetical protein